MPMLMLYEEILRRFPEISDRVREGDAELPYVVMGHIIDWLKEIPSGAIPSDVVVRLVSFADWCHEQPRGKNASDDLPTIWTVSFLEKLFDSERTRALVPRFASREQFVTGADYLRTWVGEENYKNAGKCFNPPVQNKTEEKAGTKSSALGKKMRHTSKAK
jgi:hypothetical protein